MTAPLVTASALSFPARSSASAQNAITLLSSHKQSGPPANREVTHMGYEEAKADVKKTLREADNQAKEAWRRADGEESVSDKIANAGDDIRTGLGNAGNDIRAEADKLHEDVDRKV